MNQGPYHPSVNNPNNPFGASSVASNQPHQSASTLAKPASAETPPPRSTPEPSTKLAIELNKFNKVAQELRDTLQVAPGFEERCEQAFDVANDLFGNAPTWVCFYRALLGGSGMIHQLFEDQDEFGRFLRTDQYHQIQQMLTALRSRDLPENDPNDPQRMITVRLPKSLHEAMCEEAGRLNISVNRLCISRMLQLLDPKMIPETTSKPRGRKPRTRARKTEQATQASQDAQTADSPQATTASQVPQLSYSPHSQNRPQPPHGGSSPFQPRQ